MELGTIGKGRDNEDDDGRQEGDSSGDFMGLKGGKGKQRKGQYSGYCYQRGQWGHTAENFESTAAVCCNCGQWRHMAKSCTEKGRGKKARKKHRENTRKKGRAKLAKAGGGRQRVRGNRKGIPKRERMGTNETRLKTTPARHFCQ